MTYDSVRNKVIYFGNSIATSLYSTWEWDGESWLEVYPPSGMPKLDNVKMAFDSRRGLTMAFGDLATAFQTWEWNGKNWTRRITSTVPAFARQYALCYDSWRGRLVLFTSTSNINATWEFDGIDWRQRSSLHVPLGEYSGDMVFDSRRGRSVLLRSEGGGPVTLMSHEWDGVDWQTRSPIVTPRARDNFACTFDVATGSVLMFSGAGYDDTWSYGPVQPASITRFGIGCGGASGTPYLVSGALPLPYVGNTVTLRVTKLPSGAPTTMLFGLSNTTYFGKFGLPQELTMIGMPGCSLLVQDDLSFGLVNVSGSATWGQALCVCPSIIGATFYNQVVTLDASANVLGFALSNGTASTIRDK